MLCLDQQRGTLLWSHELWRDFNGSFIINGYASSPIAYRDTVIVQVGGAGKSLVAFNAVDGKVRWQAHGFRNSQSSPILIRVDGVEQLVAYMHNEIVGVDPTSGALLWRHPVAATMNFHFNIATPVWGEGEPAVCFIGLRCRRPRPQSHLRRRTRRREGTVAERANSAFITRTRSG